jgi:hypothetical protein
LEEILSQGRIRRKFAENSKKGSAFEREVEWTDFLKALSDELGTDVDLPMSIDEGDEKEQDFVHKSEFLSF